MVNLRQETISQAKLQEYINTHSDFIFELQTLAKLNQNRIEGASFNVSHGGLYTDPNTNKTRQYDFRVTIDRDDFCIFLSIECKNIPDYYPLLIEQTKCLKEESIFSYFLNQKTQDIVREGVDLYPRQNDFIGRNINQIGIRDTQNEPIFFDDSGVYDKWSQAIQSCISTIEDSFCNINKSYKKCFFAIPCLVVPDGRLWIANYEGNYEDVEPKKIDHAFYYVGKNKNFSLPKGKYIIDNFDFKINNLHVITLSGIDNFINNLVLDSVRNICQGQRI